MLYFRMLLLMVVGLYTSRVNLAALGVDDYGIYNVVGGLVGMFAIISASLTSSISRYITFELGKGNLGNLKKVFATSIIVLFGLSVAIVTIAETAGLWFLNTHMQIPEDRLFAANCILQISIVSFVINLLCVPYNSVIIAHEKMSAFAYISVLESLLKLGVAGIVTWATCDKLILYGFLILGVSVFQRLVYTIYCNKHFAEVRCKLTFDKSLFKEMFGFAGWSFFGSASWQLMTQGVNMLVNVYYGVALNAARGITAQVDGVVNQFVNNFTMAVNPQITKYYASGELSLMHKLMFRSSKFSCFMVLLFAIPITFEVDYLLRLWLVEVPAHTANFIRLTLIITMILSTTNSQVTAMLATGNIKKYQLIVGGLGMLVFPFAWIAFSLGAQPEASYYVIILVFILQYIFRLVLMKEIVNMNIKTFVKQVLLRILLVGTISLVVPTILFCFLPDNTLRFILICFFSTLSSVLCILYIGMDKVERQYIFETIKKKIKK